MRRALLALLLLAPLAGCAAPTPPPEADVATGQIDGAVVDQLLRPFAGQSVYLTQTGARDDTSPLGGFTFRDVPVGTYTLLSNHEGYRNAMATVEVEADRITRVILQHLPIPKPVPYFVTLPHRGESQVAVAGDECTTCSWSLPLEGHPREVVLEARWQDSTPLLPTDDDIEFTIVDDLGNLVFRGGGRPDGTSPFTIAMLGEDLHEGATRLDVTVRFGPGFTTRPRFTMNEVATFYFGATHDGLFSAS